MIAPGHPRVTTRHLGRKKVRGISPFQSELDNWRGQGGGVASRALPAEGGRQCGGQGKWRVWRWMGGDDGQWVFVQGHITLRG